MLPNGEDDSNLMHLGKELQASLMRNDKLEKENHELRQEVTRLREQVSNKKQQNKCTWMKLQSSYDGGGNTDGSNMKSARECQIQHKGS